MRIPSFSIYQQRGIFSAKCDKVPSLMVIAGPNGVGKSTLLYSLRQIAGDGQILYIGPHRSSRRQSVRWQHLLSNRISMESIFSSWNTPGFEGIHRINDSRDPWNIDEATNYLKHGLCQIETERQEAIAARYDKDGEISKGTLPDPWKPFRELVNNLLPHLSFDKIDITNRNEIRCIFKAHSKDIAIDLDDLSSGEKSIIQIFYPLIEQKIRASLDEIRQVQSVASSSETCVLIDEPELHLHPNLQIKVFDYLRLLTFEKHIQVIIATHSQTIVEYANFNELFLLRPIELVDSGDNQLVQVATDEEKLRFLRNVFGNTSNITAMQPIIVVEGIDEETASKVMPDRKLYRALHSKFDQVTLIPGGGKTECKKLVQSLKKVLGNFSLNLTTIALLDADVGESASSDDVYYLPVSMIENFLLDPDAIWESIQSVVEKTSIRSVDDISSALDNLIKDMEQEEIGRRVVQSLDMAIFRSKLPIEQIPSQVEAFIANLQRQYSDSNVTKYLEEATKSVEQMKTENKRREHFHGKKLISAFYKKYLHSTGMAKDIFLFEAARYARRRKLVSTFFDEFLGKLTSKPT